MGFIFRLSLTALIILVGFSTIVESACGGLNCTTCADDHSCFWCQDNKACYDFTALSNNTCNNYCSGSSCEDICTEPCSNGIFPCSENIVGQIMLILFYGFILSMGAKILSDGSELLLELFPKWGTVIGALLLPVLGAVPDAAIILVSGAFGSVEDAQEQVSIGVGTLAGSTIMLLTVPWFAAMHLGRCDIDDVGEAIDGRCTGFSITRQGVTVDADTPTNAKIMLGTSLAYLLVQGIAFAYLKNPESINAHKYEKPFALAGFVVCMVLLIAYCVYQIFVPKLVEKREQKLEAEREAKALRLRALHIVEKWTSSRRNHNKETAPLLGSINGSESGSTTNLNSAYIEDKGQAKALAFGLKWKRKALAMFSEEGKEENGISKFAESEAKRDDDDEEDEEDPTKHFSKNIIKAIIFLIIGTGIVAFFSDPMVDTLSDFSTKIKVKPFFVSFIVTPYCSNASELISSLIFAMKKKKENASLVYSQLYGAATMNNTLCLGLFFGLVAFRGLAWSFTAETLTILLITWIIGLIGASRTTFPYWMGIPVIALYPFSLFFVWFLESIAHWT